MSVCIYCTQPASMEKILTEEHVIPRMFYPAGQENKYLKCPVCKECNSGAQKIQEQVYVWMCLLCADTNKVASQRLEKVKSAFQKGHLPIGIIKDKITLVELRTPRGIYMGQKASKVQQTPQDLSNRDQFLSYVTRGAVYEVEKKVLQKDISFFHKPCFGDFFAPKLPFFDWITKNRSSFKYYHAIPSIFDCYVGTIPETNRGVIVSRFYEKLVFASFFGECDFVEGLKNLYSHNH